jgi:hypothetical protein
MRSVPHQPRRHRDLQQRRPEHAPCHSGRAAAHSPRQAHTGPAAAALRLLPSPAGPEAAHREDGVAPAGLGVDARARHLAQLGRPALQLQSSAHVVHWDLRQQAGKLRRLAAPPCLQPASASLAGERRQQAGDSARAQAQGCCSSATPRRAAGTRSPVHRRAGRWRAGGGRRTSVSPCTCRRPCASSLMRMLALPR